jgi:hypothetical protein
MLIECVHRMRVEFKQLRNYFNHIFSFIIKVKAAFFYYLPKLLHA